MDGEIKCTHIETQQRDGLFFVLMRPNFSVCVFVPKAKQSDCARAHAMAIVEAHWIASRPEWFLFAEAAHMISVWPFDQ